jgi:cytochrome c oxidase subunit 2
MRKPHTVSVAALLLFAPICGSFAGPGFQPSSAQDPDAPVEFKMEARHFAFEPNEIKAPHGKKVRLLITAMDGDHGFKLDAFHIDRQLPKGQTVTVEFTADRSGTFRYQCSHFCGLGHGKMKGTLTVE